jgi:hypothetical protein
MADLSDEQKRRMKQSMVDAANMGDDTGLDDLNASVNRVFGGGRVQNDLGLKKMPSSKAQNEAAIRNSNLEDPNSIASVRRRIPDHAKEVMLREKLLEQQQNSKRPAWADADLSGQVQQLATDQMHKDQDAEVKQRMMLELLKQKRGY